MIRIWFLNFIFSLLIPSILYANNPKFLLLPFNNDNVKLQQGVLYTDEIRHYGSGFGLDYISGEIDNSQTWVSFDIVAPAGGVAIQSFQAGYGNLVLIRHDVTDDQGRHFFTLYAHLANGTINADLPFLSRYDQNFDEWTRVEAGDFLGKAGATGKTACASPSLCIHLHFEVFREGYFQNPVDPYDISDNVMQYTRSHYPDFPDFNDCGADYLWTECPPVFAPEGPITLAPDLDNPNLLTIDEENVYWTETFDNIVAVRKVPISGGVVSTITKEGPFVKGTGIAVDSTSVYWGVSFGYGNGGIYTLPIESEDVEPFPPPLTYANQPGDIAIDSEYVYWVDNNGGPFDTTGVRKVSIDDGSVDTLTTTNGHPRLMIIDETHVYFSYSTYSFFGGHKYFVAKIDKQAQYGNPIDLAPELESFAEGVAVDAHNIYWVEHTGTLNKASINGDKVVTPLATALNDPRRIAVDAHSVYVTEFANGEAGAGAIVKISIDGSDEATLASGLHSPYDIAVDDTYVYWTEKGTGNTDGAIKKIRKTLFEQWESIGPDIDVAFADVVIDSNNSATIYATAGWDGVLKTIDGGISWTAMNNGLPEIVNALAIDPVNPQVLYTAEYFFEGIFKTDDGGESWQRTTGPPASDLVVAPSNPTVIYAISHFHKAIFKSIDGGDSWQDVTNNLEGQTNISIGDNSLAVDPTNSDIVYAAANSSVFKTTNGGGSWEPINNGLPVTGFSFRSLAIAPSNPDIVYVGTNDGGIFKTDDGGESWNDANNELTQSLQSVVAIAIDPIDPNIVYMGTDSGVFRTTDGGGNWQTMNNGLPEGVNVLSLSIDPSNRQILYIGTADPNGIFKITLSAN